MKLCHSRIHKTLFLLMFAILLTFSLSACDPKSDKPSISQSSPGGSTSTSSSEHPASSHPSLPSSSMPDASSSSSDAAPVQNPQQQVPQTNATDIGIDRAKAIAFEDAGVTADEVTIVQEKLDRDGMRQVYEIEFLTADRQYDYEIDATTGAILESKWQLKSLVSLANGSGDIGASAAEGIALADAGVTADQVTRLRTNRELDDGLLLYEVEFILSPLEYDYTIDAATGTIIEVTKEQAR